MLQIVFLSRLQGLFEAIVTLEIAPGSVYATSYA